MSPLTMRLLCLTLVCMVIAAPLHATASADEPAAEAAEYHGGHGPRRAPHGGYGYRRMVNPHTCASCPPPSPPANCSSTLPTTPSADFSTCSTGPPGTYCTGVCDNLCGTGGCPGTGLDSGPYAAAVCDATGTWQIAAPCGGCFSADSMVVVKEAGKPVRMADIQVGQHVQCVALPDVSAGAAPTTAEWCKVMSFLHVVPDELAKTAISYQEPGSIREGRLVVSPDHLLHTLTGGAASAKAAGGARGVASVAELGAFAEVAARTVQPGDVLPVVVPGSSPPRFVAARVTGVQATHSAGYFTPVTEHPFLIADGVVVPLYSEATWLMRPAGSGGARPPPGLANALSHQRLAPLWMGHAPEQPAGTTGAVARWGAEAATMWPALADMTSAMVASVQGGKTRFDVAAWDAFFRPRYNAWKAGGGAAITAEEAVAAFKAAYAA